MSGWKQGQKLQTILHVNFEFTGGRRNRRKWQPTPVLSPGKSHGQRSLEGYSPESPRVGHDLATEHTQSRAPPAEFAQTKRPGKTFREEKLGGRLCFFPTEGSYFLFKRTQWLPVLSRGFLSHSSLPRPALSRSAARRDWEEAESGKPLPDSAPRGRARQRLFCPWAGAGRCGASRRAGSLTLPHLRPWSPGARSCLRLTAAQKWRWGSAASKRDRQRAGERNGAGMGEH